MYRRALDIRRWGERGSWFLFGPRQSGKTTLLRTELPDAPYFNLAEADTFRELTAYPETIRQRLTGRESVILVDEIQRLPALLNEVQVMMDRNPGLRFVLTGSSARSLRRRGVNLLGGRAGTLHLFPLVSPEVEFEDWERRLGVGSLPGVLTSGDPWERLRSYVSTYLTEEIRAEGFVRSLESFSHFLAAAAATNGGIVNYTQVGSDAGVAPRTVREYFQLLEDTLLGFLLPPYQGTAKRKPVAASKFYLFDVGVANYFGKRFHLERESPDYGSVLEHALVLECRAYLSYRRRFEELRYWRSQHGQEVDLVIGEKLAIEIKASRRVGRRDLKGLLALREEKPGMRFLVVAQEPHARRTEEGIEVLPVEDFLRRLWEDELLDTLVVSG